MTNASIIKALLDKEVVIATHECSAFAAVKSILFSQEFFDLHAPYLRQMHFSDEHALMTGKNIAERKTVVSMRYVEELMILDGDEFIRGLYWLFLGREVDEPGLEAYRIRLEQVGKAESLRHLSASPEAATYASTIIVPHETRQYIASLT